MPRSWEFFSLNASIDSAKAASLLPSMRRLRHPAEAVLLHADSQAAQTLWVAGFIDYANA